jgi:hypothetical protein
MVTVANTNAQRSSIVIILSFVAETNPSLKKYKRKGATRKDRLGGYRFTKNLYKCILSIILPKKY